MGGIGSGRYWRQSKKRTTDTLRIIDIREWEKKGLLRCDSAFVWHWLHEGKTHNSILVTIKKNCLVLSYRYSNLSNTHIEKQYSIETSWTKCNFGSKRPWFICPTKNCTHRVAILYHNELFACRHCHNLAYSSQREGSGDRAARRVNKIRQQLEWDCGVFNSYLRYKPLGMSQEKFETLVQKHDYNMTVALTCIYAQISPPK